jgi:outer membrane protein OmpA-like peptidoglycan-associated protein
MRTLSALTVGMALVATPASAHQFLDYFDYGRAELSPAGFQMVRAAAAYAAMGRPIRIMVNAHMDTAESLEFSDELSRRRAQAVASELVLLGTDPSVIELRGHGATLLARPTPPNTPERLNRRVVVDINF